MPKVLQILIKPDKNGNAPPKSAGEGDEVKVEVVDLRVAQPDYGQLVEKIFEADRVQVW